MKKILIAIVFSIIVNTSFSQVWFIPLSATKNNTYINIDNNIYISNELLVIKTINIQVLDYLKESVIFDDDEIGTQITFTTLYGDIILSFMDYHLISTLYFNRYYIELTLGYIDGTLLL